MSERGYCRIIPMARVKREIELLSAISYIILIVVYFRKTKSFFESTPQLCLVFAFQVRAFCYDPLFLKTLSNTKIF